MNSNNRNIKTSEISSDSFGFEFDNSFAELSANLYPEVMVDEIDDLNNYLYSDLNNGVYQAGFATTQEAYEEAYSKVFAVLDAMEGRLSDGRDFLFGNDLTESDIRLFVTLIRFDAAYHGLFVPLKVMYPDADIPCIQLSLVRSLDPQIHIKIGKALQNIEWDN